MGMGGWHPTAQQDCQRKRDEWKRNLGLARLPMEQDSSNALCPERNRFSSCPVHHRLKDGAPTDLWNRTHVVLSPGTTRFLEHTFICSNCSLCVDTIFWQINFERSRSLTSIMDDSDDSSVIRQLIPTQGSQVWRKTNQHILQHVRAKNKILLTNYFLPFFWDNSLWSTGDILVIPAID
jgi:hypothetical protein